MKVPSSVPTSGLVPGQLAESLALPGIDAVIPFGVRLTIGFRGVRERCGLLLHGPSGWGEWSPFDEYDDVTAARWLDAALDAACGSPPPRLRDRIPLNVTVPAVESRSARAIVATSNCSTAKVKVAEPGQTLAEDLARVAAVRAALGQEGRIRIDANAAWSVSEATDALRALEESAGGLEYAEQPCASLEALAEVRARTGVRIAADEAIRRGHADPALIRDAVDVAVVKVQPSGGASAALALIGEIGLPVVISSALETSVGLAAGVRLAGAVPTLDHACGLATGLLLREDVVERPLRPCDGGVNVIEASDPVVRSDVPSPPRERIEWIVARVRRAAALSRAGSVP